MFEHDDDDPVLRRLTAEEGAVLDATELVCRLLDESGVSRSELARRLGVRPSEITHRLRGRNLTVKSLAATLDALDHRLEFTAKPRQAREVPVVPVTWYDELFRTSVVARTPITYDVSAMFVNGPGIDSVAV